jgi:hypothetical protein
MKTIFGRDAGVALETGARLHNSKPRPIDRPLALRLA